MISKRIPTCAAFVLLTLHTHPALAGAWVLEEGKWQIINNLVYESSSKFFDQSGNTTAQPTFKKTEYNPYIEYGLWEHTTVGANIFLQRASSNGESNFGLSNAEIFARTRLWENQKYVISVQPMINLPGGVEDSDTPTIGTEDIDFGLSALVGYNFNFFRRKHYSETELAYRHRTGDQNDQFRFNTTLGLNVHPKWQVLAQQFAILSVDSVRGASFTQSARDDFDLVKAQLSGVYHYNEQLSLQAGGFYSIRGRNVGRGVGGLFAVWTRF